MRISILLLFVMTSLHAHAQTGPDLFITLNGNLFVPLQSENDMFPMVGYNKELTPKLLIGGFGIGFAYQKMMSKKLSIKAQGIVFRQAYWQQYLFRVGPQLSDVIGEGTVSTFDYTIGSAVIPHFHFSQVFSVGLGVGMHVLLFSNSYLRHDWTPNGNRSLGDNRYYKSFMPTIPMEASLRLQKWALTMRYDHALLNRFKNKLSDHKKEKYGLLLFEIGYKIN
jgi:hypothetical protein